MSKIRQNLEYYRTPDKVETDIGGDNVSDKYANANKVIGDVTVYVSPSGSDTTGDGTSSSPYETPQFASASINEFIINDDATVTIQLDKGTFDFTEAWNIDVNQGGSLAIKGYETSTTFITDIISVTSSGAWAAIIELSLMSNADVEVGGHLILTGLGDLDNGNDNDNNLQSALNGTWRVIGKSGGTGVTIEYTHYYHYKGLPTGTFHLPVASPILNFGDPLEDDTRIGEAVPISSIINITTPDTGFLRIVDDKAVDNLSWIGVEQSSAVFTASGFSYGVAVGNGASMRSAGKLSFIGMDRGLWSQNSGTMNIADLVCASTCSIGMGSYSNSTVYCTTFYSSNCLYGFESGSAGTILALYGLSSADGLRAFNNNIGFQISKGSHASIQKIVAKFNVQGLWIDIGSNLWTNKLISNQNSETGMHVSSGSVVHSDSSWIRGNSGYGISTAIKATLELLSIIISFNTVGQIKLDGDPDPLPASPINGAGQIGVQGSYILVTV